MGYHTADTSLQVSGALGFIRSYAPIDEEGRRIGGHLTGSTLTWKEAYVESQDLVGELIDKIEKEDKGSKMMRCIYLRVSQTAWLSLGKRVTDAMHIP
jgi:hypothetical protein